MTKIEWTNATWSPVTGCTPISPGCANCYARRMATRLAGRCGYDRGHPFRITHHEDRYDEPLHWRKPRMIFVCSMGDLFHEDVPIGCQLGVYETISDDAAQHHTFQILTKRPQNMADFHHHNVVGVLPNLWLGVTSENQPCADERIPILLDIPAAVRFVSLEPCLSRIDLTPWLHRPRLDWVIAGAETGPRRRWCDTRWVADIVEQCRAVEVPVFVKALHVHDGKGRPQVVKDINHISNQLGYAPEDLRQCPKGST